MADSRYQKIDDGVYRLERGLVVVLSVVIASIVFVDLVHRAMVGNNSKFALVSQSLAQSAGLESSALLGWGLVVGLVGLVYFGIRSTRLRTPVAPWAAGTMALGGVLVAYGLVRALGVLVPQGFMWAQPLALVLILWVGFIGASMGIHRGYYAQVGLGRAWIPLRWRAGVQFVSGTVTTVVCVALFWLSLRYVITRDHSLMSLDGAPGGGLSFAILPVVFALMSVRFAAKSLGALHGDLDDVPDLIESVVQWRTLDGDAPPSEVATEAMPVKRPDMGTSESKPSAIETMRSVVPEPRDPFAPKPQSKVPTDTHDIEYERSGMIGGEISRMSQTRELCQGPAMLSEDTRELPVEPGFAQSVKR